MAHSDAYTYVDKALPYYAYCHKYIGEVNLTEMNAEMHLDSFSFAHGQSYKDMLSPKKYLKLAKVLDKHFKINLEEVNHFLPIYIQALCASSTIKQEYISNLDYHLYSEAVASGMEIAGLESFEEQCALAKSLDIPTQMKMLQTICKKPNRVIKHVAKLSAYYAKNKQTLLYKSCYKEMGSLRKVMLLDRNVRMANCIIDESKTACFITVGAGHLGGNKGILSLLKKAGFKVSPLV
jgi:uncharacterized protein